MGAWEVLDAEVAADVLDDVGDRALVEVVVEVGIVEALVELGVESLGLGAVGPALDGVLDRADDLLACGEAALARVLGPTLGCEVLWAGRGGIGELASEGDGAAQGAGDAVEGDGGVGCGCRGGFGCCAGLGVGRSCDLAVEGAGKVGADLDQLVEDLAVVLGVLVTLVRETGAGVAGWFGTGGAWRTSGRISEFLAGVVKRWIGGVTRGVPGMVQGRWYYVGL